MEDFLPSQRKGRKLIHENFEYVKERQHNDKTYWQCSRKDDCKARAHTVDGKVTRLVKEHTHAPSGPKIRAAFAYSKMKEMASSSDSTNQAILGTVTEAMTQFSLPHLPPKETIKRTLRNIKATSFRPVPLPGSVDELEIPETYRFTSRGDLFLQYDSGSLGSGRFLIFGSSRGIQVLSTSKYWFADGTFKVVPELFYQLYTVHAKFLDSVVPVLYILMTRKTEEMYTRVFEEIRNLCPDGRTEQAMMDFELAAINGFRGVFPACRVRCCYFHFAQCIFRKIQAQGLQPLYSSDDEFALYCQMLAAMALVPAEHVDEAFQTLQDFLPPSLDPVLDYFEENFIGTVERRVRTPPRFERDLWCHFDTVLNTEAKTNNSSEAWHRGFQASAGCHHPTIWKFLKLLLREDSVTLLRIEHLGKGIREPKKRTYVQLATNLKRLAERFDQTDVLEYIRGIAYNIRF